MDRLALFGVSYRRGGVEALEIWQAHLKNHPLSFFRGLGFSEVVALSTCNRCDIVVAIPPGMSMNEAHRLVSPSEGPLAYAYRSEGAVEQIARICSSLDSLNPGEDQIMKQVREAWQAAEKAETVGSITRWAFPAAFRIAKRIRRDVELAPLQTSLFSLARPEMEACLPGQATIGVIGLGEIGQVALKHLDERPHTRLVLVGRTPQKALAIRPRLSSPTSILPLSDFLASPPDLDALVCATPQADLLTPSVVSKMPSLRVLVDLGLPRNVEASALSGRSILLLDVATLQGAGQRRRQKIEANLIRAEEILQDEVEREIGDWIERQLGPSLQKIRQKYLETIPSTLPHEEAQSLANRFAHLPIKGLRALARQHGLDAARTFLEAAEIVSPLSPR